MKVCNLNADWEEDLSIIAENNPHIQKAVGVLMELGEDERTRLLYKSREKAMCDDRARYNWTIKSAKEAAKLEIAKNVLKMKIPIDAVVKITGLAREEIEKLAK